MRGKLVTRGKAKKADFVLYYKPNIPIALIEAKDNSHSVGDGIQQALEYAETLNIPFVFTSNGDGFVFHDRTGASMPREANLGLDAFPSPADLWARFRAWKGLDAEAEAIVLQDYYDDGSGKAPRYYQVNAVNAALEAIAKRQDRILLVMATGTGKTYTAFQIIWRLWKAGRKKRILFLADRNVLIDQTIVNDFRPFGGTMAKLSTNAKTIERQDGSTVDLTLALDRKRRIDTAYEVYLGLYQAITGPEERQKLFREFSPGFFDLIVIDECHRGSAAEDSAWREILEYFSSATQIGLTATPKETKYVSNIDYFGDPVFSYSLKQGIRDGFLAPYKVVKVHIDRDVEGYRPEKGQLDRDGKEVEDRIYNAKDFDRNLVIDDSHEAGGAEGHGLPKGKRRPLPKDHCLLRRSGTRRPDAPGAYQRERRPRGREPALRHAHHRQRCRGPGATRQLHRPGIEVSRPCHHLAPPVDRRRCADLPADRARPRGRLDDRVQADRRARHPRARGHGEVLLHPHRFPRRDQPFRGPGFRRRTGADLRARRGRAHRAARRVADRRGGRPLPETPGADETVVAGQPDLFSPLTGGKVKKVYIDGVGATIIAERVEYLDEHGKLVTESLRDFTKKALRRHFASLDDFLKRWNAAERKQAVVEELAAEGLPLDPIVEELGKDLDPFDLICHVAFDAKPLTRRERAEYVKKRDVFTKYGDKARAVLDALLAKYADEGVLNLDDTNVLTIPPLSTLGTRVELVHAFGGKSAFEQAVHGLQSALYQETA